MTFIVVSINLMDYYNPVLCKCNENLLTTRQTHPVALLIRNCSYLVRNPAQIERDCDILMQGSRIQAIGKDLPVPAGVEIIDGSGCAAVPGLINTHTHLYQNLLKGVSPGLRLVPWCNQVLFPALGTFRDMMDRQGKRLSYLWTALASVEMIRGGITCCVDMDNTSAEIIHAWEDIGFRGVLAYTLTNRWVPAELRQGEETVKQHMLDFIREYHRPAGLTTVCVAPSTLFLCTDDFITWAGEQAQVHDLGMQIHVAEIRSEVEDQVKETGHSPVEHLHTLGLLNERLSAVHMVHVSEQDMERMAGSRAQVVHCPKSNMKLADGIAPVTAFHARGIPVSLGTDGCASNDLLDMWEEMRAGLLLARVSEDQPEAMTPQQAFSMATDTAARVARVEAGELQPGKLADLAVMELKAAHLQPFHDGDLLNALVFCGKAQDVRDTIIHGQAVMRNRRITTIDEGSLFAEVNSLRNEMPGIPWEQPAIPMQRGEN
jgi:5-methylthioadenosine/S-adenosylhomocysteine deaminase